MLLDSTGSFKSGEVRLLKINLRMLGSCGILWYIILEATVKSTNPDPQALMDLCGVYIAFSCGQSAMSFQYCRLHSIATLHIHNKSLPYIFIII